MNVDCSVVPAIVARLSGNTNVVSILGSSARVYDTVVSGIVYPYVVISKCDVDINRNMLSILQTYRIEIKVYDRCFGMSGIRACVDAIVQCLTTEAITVTSSILIDMCVDAITFDSIDSGNTQLASINFRAVTLVDA